MALRNRRLDMGNKPVAGVADAVDAKDAVNKGQMDAAISAIDLTPYAEKTTQVIAGTGLSGGGDLSANRTLDLADTAVTPGEYINPTLTIDQQGRVTAAENGASPDLVLLETITATSGATKATSASFAGYREIVIVGENISASGAAAPNLMMEMSGNSGSSWTAAGAVSASWPAGNSHYVVIRLPEPNAPTAVKCAVVQMFSAVTGTGSQAIPNGYLGVIAALTNVRLSWASGETFDGAGGVFKVYGRG